MAFLPPVPNCGKSGDAAYGYQMKAGSTAGSFFIPVLFGELLTGPAVSKVAPDSPVS